MSTNLHRDVDTTNAKNPERRIEKGNGSVPSPQTSLKGRSLSSRHNRRLLKFHTNPYWRRLSNYRQASTSTRAARNSEPNVFSEIMQNKTLKMYELVLDTLRLVFRQSSRPWEQADNGEELTAILRERAAAVAREPPGTKGIHNGEVDTSGAPPPVPRETRPITIRFESLWWAKQQSLLAWETYRLVGWKKRVEDAFRDGDSAEAIRLFQKNEKLFVENILGSIARPLVDLLDQNDVFNEQIRAIKECLALENHISIGEERLSIKVAFETIRQGIDNLLEATHEIKQQAINTSEFKRGDSHCETTAEENGMSSKGQHEPHSNQTRYQNPSIIGLSPESTIVLKILRIPTSPGEGCGTTNLSPFSPKPSNSMPHGCDLGELDISHLTDSFGQLNIGSDLSANAIFDRLKSIARPNQHQYLESDHMSRQFSLLPWLPQPLDDLDSGISLLISLPIWQISTPPVQNHYAKVLVRAIYQGLLEKSMTCASDLYGQILLQRLEDAIPAFRFYGACVGRLAQHYQQLVGLDFPFIGDAEITIRRLEFIRSNMAGCLNLTGESGNEDTTPSDCTDGVLETNPSKEEYHFQFCSYQPLALVCYLVPAPGADTDNGSMMQDAGGEAPPGLVSMEVRKFLLTN